MATFWKRAAHSVGRVLSLYFLYLYFSYFPFGFESGVWFLIATVPVRCLLVTFTVQRLHFPSDDRRRRLPSRALRTILELITNLRRL